jgi:ABC-type glutathione transport system ATPase component
MPDAGSIRISGHDPVTETAAATRPQELITLIDLPELADSPTRVLSRGQKQRLSLARAPVRPCMSLACCYSMSQLRAPIRRPATACGTSCVASPPKVRHLLVSSHVLSGLDEMACGAVYVSLGSDGVS